MDSNEPADKRQSKHKRSHDKDSDRKSRKKHKHDGTSKKRKHGDKVDKEKIHVIDDDPNDDDMWIEKNIDMDGERVLTTDIPTAESLKLSSTVSTSSNVQLPPTLTTETPLQRDEWMLLPYSTPTIPDATSSKHVYHTDESYIEDYGESSEGRRGPGGSVDFFSSLGTDAKRRGKPSRPDPEKPQVSYRELNADIREGRHVDHDAPLPPLKPVTPGGPGSQWRMMRLRRVYEAAEDEGKPVEEIGIDRFGSMQAFEDAKEERRILDERDGKHPERGRGSERKAPEMEKRMMFTDVGGSGASSRSSSFRRPGIGNNTPSTPSPPATVPPLSHKRLDTLRMSSRPASPLNQTHTPIPSVMTPPVASRARGLSPSSLNKLQAKALRAKLMGAPDAEALQREYDEESRRATGDSSGEGGSSVRTKVEVLPTLDGHGKLYDVGQGRDDGPPASGNRKKKEKFETRDPRTGDIVRYNADDDSITLGEMLRQERFGGGMADQKDLDTQFAKAIMGDGKFENDLDYIDDNAEKLGRQKMRSDAMKRQFAIHDYKRTQKVMASCPFCFGEDDSPPKAPVIAMGTRVYLSCPVREELLDGHCLIVPIQHHLTMLEGDDDVWDEVKNFMKCLMHMFADQDKGVVFYETVITLKWQKHTYIECIPLSWDQFEEIPAYFKESILASEAEWSQHKKLIDFSARPGGFRRAMVPNLPYFMVQFDHKGEKGYGHVIEGTGESAADGEDGAMEEGEKGGGEFPSYFASEIIGNVLDIEARRWRRPRRIDFAQNKDRVALFRKKYDSYDWTHMIGK